MDPVRSPYAPGSGRKPSALVGRESVLSKWDVALRRADERERTDQPFVIYGLRGVGKTVLLTQLRHDAEKRDWIVAQIEAGSGDNLRELIGEALYEPLHDFTKPSAGRRVLTALKTMLSFKASYDITGTWNFGLDLSESAGGGADTGILQTDLRKVIRDVGRAAKEEGVGLAILIDEAQDVDKQELMVLSSITQVAAQDDWPVLFAFAGLPSLPQILAEAKSYTERFQYEHIERLSDAEAKLALTDPANEEGAEWSPDAVVRVVETSDRYPYFLQQFGQETWSVAAGSPITLSDAEIGILKGQQQLDNGFFRARWDRTTEAEKRYMRAMCPEGDVGVGSSDVAYRLNKSVQSLGPTRANLIHKGLVYAPDHGVVRFTVPGMSAFIERQVG